MGVREVARKAYNWLTLANVGPAARSAEFSIAPMPIDDMWREMQDPLHGPLPRAKLMQLSGVVKARDMVCTVATLPLVEIDAARKRIDNGLLDQFDQDVPNVVHLAQTLEDLLFDGIAWWQVITRDGNNKPTWVRRRAPESVIIQPKNGREMPAPLPSGHDPRGAVIMVDGEEVDAENMIRFDSPKWAARQTLGRIARQVEAMDDAAVMYARNPRPLDYFTPREGQPDPDRKTIIQPFLQAWARVRRVLSTAYVPAWAEYKQVEAPTPANLQLVELEKWAQTQLAVALGLQPEDFGVSTTSRTYQNAVDERQNRINTVLAFFMRAITDRLSMIDITRRRNRVVFDLDDFLRADPKTRWETYQIQHTIFGDPIRDEIRAEEGKPKLPAGPPVGPQQQPLRAVPSSTAAAAGGRTGRAPARAPSLAAARDGSGADAAAFDMSVASFADDNAAQFAGLTVQATDIDVGRRTITGLAVPYGAIAFSRGRRFRIAPGALIIPTEVHRVKALEDHNYSAAFGHLQSYRETALGLEVTIKVGRGEHGDRMLSLAQDKVKDGLSVGLDWDGIPGATAPDPENRGVILVRRAHLREVTQTAMPSFDTARVTRVAAMKDQPGGPAMECTTCGQQHAAGVACPTPAPAAAPPAAAAATFTAEQVAAMFGFMQALTPSGANADAPAANAGTSAGDAGGEGGQVRTPDPTATATPTHLNAGRGAGGGTGLQAVREPLPYRFGFTAKGERALVAGDHEFSNDLLMCRRAGDVDMVNPSTDAGRRVAEFLQAEFAVVTTDINELNPTIQRPDMYVDQRDYPAPLWDFVNKGAPPNGVQPFMFPKFSSASGLVGDHTEGVEPTSGTLVTTSQTVTPTALSGAADLTREVFDMGGNPAVSTLVWNQMRKSWREGLESATATFLGTLTAATDITLGVAPTDAALIAAWKAGIIGLLFGRQYDFRAFGVEQRLYTAFAEAEYDSGEPAFPIINPSNRDGTARARFASLDLMGVEGTPSWALPATNGALNSSWLFDPSVMFGWATPPQRLEFAGIDADGDYAPVAMVRIGIWGYKAFANTDIGGVRQVTYDNAA